MMEGKGVHIGLARTVALHCCASMLYQICYQIRCLFF
jgi:hypothetical protein